MHNIITKDGSTHSCHDFELNIDRTNEVSYRYSYPKTKKLKGIVFIVPGFGIDANSEYINKLRTYIAEEFSVLTVNVFYHCFYSRLENGAILEADNTDLEKLHVYAKEYNLKFSYTDSTDIKLEKLDAAIQNKKNNNTIDKKFKLPVTMTIFPKDSEYQNFGIMQALDHINILNKLEKETFNFSDNYSVTMMGSSHGGYISYLTAKLAPNKIDCVIDNSSYVAPPYQYIVGKEKNYLIAETELDYSNNLSIHCFTKTNWTLDRDSKNYFSSDRHKIRDIANQEHLEKMCSTTLNKTTYISYHSAQDLIAPLQDKMRLYASLKKLGFKTKLHIINDTSQVDGKFIKTLTHGLDTSLKELANRELPYAINIKHKKDSVQTISYLCDTMKYIFEEEDGIFQGKTANIYNINEIVTQNFNDNISYIQANHPELFSKLSALDSAIDQGHYIPKYELVHENGNFDVLENTTNSYLYNKNSSTHASLASQSIDYNREDNLFKGFHKHIVSDEDLTRYEKEAPFENQMSGFAPIMHYDQQNSQANKTLKTIDKFVFFGAGLGLHIDSIHKKISSKVYFIIEDDLELFRLSLFTTNYKKIAYESTLIFSVFEDNSEFAKSSDKFLKTKFYYNHYIKYFHLLSHSEDKRNQFHISITSQSHLLFFYNSLLTQYLKPLDYLFDNYKFLDNTFNFSDKRLDDKPLLLIAAGPSLQKNITWLKENHQNFITVALSATLLFLEKENIRPNIITHLDAFDTAAVHIEKINSYEFFKDSLCFFSSRTPLRIIEKFSKQNVYLFENGTNYKKSSLKLSAPCVGSISYQLLLKSGAKNIYLLGLDLAIDSLTGKTHSDSHEYIKTLGVEENAFDTSLMTYKGSLFSVEGNFIQSVLTTPHFQTSIDSINNSTNLLKQKQQNIFNLSDGAKFNDTISKKLNEINFKNSNSTIEIQVDSSIALNGKEITTLNEKLSHAKEMLKSIEKFKSIKKTTTDEYLENLEELCLELINKNSLLKYELNRVIDTYFRYILSYIFDFFNTQSDKSDSLHINNLNNMLLNHLSDIISYYINNLSQKDFHARY